MKIVINIASLNGGALIREQNILCALSDIDHENEYIILCHKYQVSKISFIFGSNFHLYPVKMLPGFWGRFLWENINLPLIVKNIYPDVLLFPLHMTNFYDVCKKVIVIRNAAPFYDNIIQNSNLYQRFRLLTIRLGTWISIRRANYVIFISETTRTRVYEKLRLNNIASKVVKHGLPRGFSPKSSEESAPVLKRYGIKKPYLLSVGLIARYKNLRELIEAYILAQDTTRQIPPLYIVGFVYEEDYFEDIQKIICKKGINEKVHFIGTVVHEDLPYLYSNCELFIFTSACENSPLVLIEAMACGAAILTSNQSFAKEMCGDVPIYFNPFYPRDIARTIMLGLSDKKIRETLSKKAVARASYFSWIKAAKEMKEVFESVVHSG